MRRGGGKQKGASFERTVAVALSKWCSFGTREDCLWRSAMSGGRATVARKKGDNLSAHAGDLSSTHPMGQPFLDRFYCELKNYQDLNYSGLINDTGNLFKFWQITVTEANCYKKSPMLIAKQNRMPIVVFMQMGGLGIVQLCGGNCVIIAPRIGAYGVLFDDFLINAKPL